MPYGVNGRERVRPAQQNLGKLFNGFAVSGRKAIGPTIPGSPSEFDF
jgi:hypothetical protein